MWLAFVLFAVALICCGCHGRASLMLSLQDPFGGSTANPQATGQPNDPFNPPGPPGGGPGPGATTAPTGATTTTTTTTRRNNPPPPPPPPPKGEECIFGQAHVSEGETPRCLTADEWWVIKAKTLPDKEGDNFLYLVLLGILLAIVMIWGHMWTRGKFSEMARVFLERLRGLSDDEDEDDSS
jgi:hypothetical protein